MKGEKTSVIINASLKRLPLYYNYLKNKSKEGEVYASSTLIANSLNLNPIQVRKDLAFVSSTSGKPRMGFEILPLISDLETFLGYNNVDEAVLVGVGKLGRTLLSYDGFKDYGLDIIAGFDSDENLAGIKINGKPVLPISKLKTVVSRLNVHIGIIAVTKEAAQKVCNLLVDAGIKAIWNFAPTLVEVPKGIIIRNENLAASLAALSLELIESQKKNVRERCLE